MSDDLISRNDLIESIKKGTDGFQPQPNQISDQD